MPEEQVDVKVDVKEHIETMGEKFNEFKKTLAQIKDHDVEIKSWSFNVNKADKSYIVDFAGKVEITPKKKQ
jgi:hypothetical protein